VTRALVWLEPLRSSIPELDGRAWRDLARLADDLQQRWQSAPAPLSAAWSPWLLGLRRDLAGRHHAPAGPAGSLWQTLAQFLAGFQDLDLRDATGTGHGAMVLRDAAAGTAAHWRRRLSAGQLVGIAATERRGGSRIREITTRADLGHDGRWQLTGEKWWVSRLVESTGFVVFFRDPHEQISAAIIDAHQARLERKVLEPAGLGGWSWGLLRLNSVFIDPGTDLVGPPGDGLAVFHRHFTRFRPLVTATALGTAAGAHTLVTQELAQRVKAGTLPRVRDNALVTLGRTHAEITAALLATLTTSRLAASGHPHADLAARTGKAAGIDTAHRVVGELAPLIGASGFQRDHPIAKARADLTGLLYADGVHDSLYRSGGQTLLRSALLEAPAPARARRDEERPQPKAA
jgi:alkylation response protein AidB-like acyl-CoA dehydrogenase